jgi:hypothetical protein
MNDHEPERIEVLLRHLPGETEEKYEKVGVSGVRPRFEEENFPNLISPERYRYAHLLGKKDTAALRDAS